jgi:hypothetical protein
LFETPLLPGGVIRQGGLPCRQQSLLLSSAIAEDPEQVIVACRGVVSEDGR